MPGVRYLNKTTLVGQDAVDAIITTDPVPLNGMNYADVMANVLVLSGTGGGTPTIDFVAQGSNDGQSYITTGALSLSGLTATGLAEAHGQAAFAFMRFQITVRLTGSSAGDLVWATCDLHVNFTQS